MILGLTGGIGSGKSLVSGILQKEYGFEVIQTDRKASELMKSDALLMERLKRAFGEDIYRPDGTPDREKYAGLIYGNRKMQELSDSIVHPAVWEAVREQIRNTPERNIAVETALPGEELKKICDCIWHIRTEEPVRVERLMETRAYTREFAESVIKRQPSETSYGSIADRVIENNGSIQELREEIRDLL